MKILSWLLAFFCTLTVTAQDKLVIMGKSPDYYVVYPANGSENLQNISNRFGFSVTRLSSYNRINVNPNAAFAKGTRIKIPVTKDNLLQHEGENCAPVVHIVSKGENLYRLSTAYHKVPIASLREWNKLKKDIVKNGQQLIIGYMVNASPVTTAEKKITPAKDIPAMVGPVVTQQEDPNKKYTEKKQTPAPAPLRNDMRGELTPEKSAPVVKLPVTETNAATKTEKNKEPVIEAEYTPREGDEGYFAIGYAEHGKDQAQQFRSGDAAIFKTISGWTDRKFYVLMNDVAPKTIIRITGTANKTICAMVLGPLQETKGASGLLLRLSNSAASALGLTDQKFTITITYFE
ncbi:MAG: LysM peptidoglycan-binding domain-containing protein [Bacteroidota bacterium]